MRKGKIKTQNLSEAYKDPGKEINVSSGVSVKKKEARGNREEMSA